MCATTAEPRWWLVVPLKPKTKLEDRRLVVPNQGNWKLWALLYRADAGLMPHRRPRRGPSSHASGYSHAPCAVAQVQHNRGPLLPPSGGASISPTIEAAFLPRRLEATAIAPHAPEPKWEGRVDRRAR
jgi:hypothetical protein